MVLHNVYSNDMKSTTSDHGNITPHWDRNVDALLIKEYHYYNDNDNE